MRQALYVPLVPLLVLGPTLCSSSVHSLSLLVSKRLYWRWACRGGGKVVTNLGSGEIHESRLREA